MGQAQSKYKELPTFDTNNLIRYETKTLFQIVKYAGKLKSSGRHESTTITMDEFLERKDHKFFVERWSDNDFTLKNTLNRRTYTVNFFCDEILPNERDEKWCLIPDLLLKLCALELSEVTRYMKRNKTVKMSQFNGDDALIGPNQPNPRFNRRQPFGVVVQALDDQLDSQETEQHKEESHITMRSCEDTDYTCHSQTVPYIIKHLKSVVHRFPLKCTVYACAGKEYVFHSKSDFLADLTALYKFIKNVTKYTFQMSVDYIAKQAPNFILNVHFKLVFDELIEPPANVVIHCTI